MDAKNCGCRVEHRIEGSFTNRERCRYPALLAERESLAASWGLLKIEIHHLEKERDALAAANEELQREVARWGDLSIQWTVDKDALAGEVAALKLAAAIAIKALEQFTGLHGGLDGVTEAYYADVAETAIAGLQSALKP